MRKLLLAGVASFVHVLVIAGVALAEGGSTLPSPGGDQVKGVVVHAPDGTAFTGADVGMWLAAAAALAVIGGVVFVAGRRRAATR